MPGKNWTKQEDKLLADHYKKGGAKACVAAGLDRPIGSIKHRASDKGFSRKPKPIPYSDVQIIARLYSVSGSGACKKNGLSRNYERWEIQRLCAERGIRHLTLKSICEDWAMKLETVRQRMLNGLTLYRALTLPTRKPATDYQDGEYARGEWRERELDLLRRFYPTGGYIGCQNAGLRRSGCAITSQAYRWDIQVIRIKQLIDGKEQTIREAALSHDLNPDVARKRIKRGWSVDRAVSVPSDTDYVERRGLAHWRARP